MTNQTDVNLGGKLHGVCLSVYCTLMLTSLMVGHAHVRLAQMGGGISARVQNGALNALSEASKQGFAGTEGATMPVPIATFRPVSAVSSAGSLSELAQTIKSKGDDAPMGARTAARLGFTVDQIPCKQVAVEVVSEQHGIDVCTINSRDFFIFNRHSGDDKWDFMADETGSVVKAFHGVKGTRLQEMPVNEAAPLVSAEKAFWLQWESTGGNLVGSNGQGASKS